MRGLRHFLQGVVARNNKLLCLWWWGSGPRPIIDKFNNLRFFFLITPSNSHIYAHIKTELQIRTADEHYSLQMHKEQKNKIRYIDDVHVIHNIGHYFRLSY